MLHILSSTFLFHHNIDQLIYHILPIFLTSLIASQKTLFIYQAFSISSRAMIIFMLFLSEKERHFKANHVLQIIFLDCSKIRYLWENSKCTWVNVIAIKSSYLQLHWGYRTRINKITVYSNDLRTIHCWKDIKRPILENISMYWKSLRKHQKYYHRINSVETTDFIMHIIVMCHNTCLWDFFYFEAKLCVLVPETKKKTKSDMK